MNCPPFFHLIWQLNLPPSIHRLIYSASAWQILFLPPCGVRLLAWVLNKTWSQHQLGLSMIIQYMISRGALFHFQRTKYLESNYTQGGLLSALLIIWPIAIYNCLFKYLQSELSSGLVWELTGLHQWHYPYSELLSSSWLQYVKFRVFKYIAYFQVFIASF